MSLTQSRLKKDLSECIRDILNDTVLSSQLVNETEPQNYWKEVFKKLPKCEPFNCESTQ